MSVSQCYRQSFQNYPEISVIKVREEVLRQQVYVLLVNQLPIEDTKKSSQTKYFIWYLVLIGECPSERGPKESRKRADCEEQGV